MREKQKSGLINIDLVQFIRVNGLYDNHKITKEEACRILNLERNVFDKYRDKFGGLMLEV